MMSGGLRWDRYFMAHGVDFTPFWKDLHDDPQRRVLFICGAGFDPRSLAIIKGILSAGICVAECRLIEFSAGSGLASEEDMERARRNKAHLGQMFAGDSLKAVTIGMRSSEGRSIGGIRISEAFRQPQTYMGFSDVVIDITALPGELYFPLIGTLLRIWHSESAASLRLGSLHVAVCDNPQVDSMILPGGGDKAEIMFGFPGSVQRASIGDPIRVWAPVLGENQEDRLQKINEFIGPEVIAPVLPFPARRLRRGDDMLIEYRRLIYETWAVDPSDLIYADEQDPFDVYAKLSRLALNYLESLKPVGTTQVVVSSHSSKLHSLGVLLAAWDQGLSVAHVQPSGHLVDGSFGPEHEQGELFDIWLAGEPYAEG